MNSAQFLATLTAALGCALMAGLFFAISISIMNALARLPDAHGMAAMQMINIAIVNPLFLVVFIGTAIACVATAVLALLNMGGPGAGLALAGALLYLLGSLLVTAAFNIPRNNVLAALRPDDPASAAVWREYGVSWTRWNHVRGLAAFGATVLLILSLRA